MRGSRSAFRASSRTIGSTSSLPPARCTHCSARTARARARSRTSSRPLPAGRRRDLLERRPVRFQVPRDALDAGICMVHQHFRLVEPFTVPRTSSSATTAARPHVPAATRLDRATRRGAVEALRASLSIRAPASGSFRSASSSGSRSWKRSTASADPDPRRADRRADTAGSGALVRDAARDGGGGRTVIFISHKLHEVKAVADGSRCSAADARSPPWRRRTRRSDRFASADVGES